MKNTLYLIGRLGKNPQIVTVNNSLTAIVNIADSQLVEQKQKTIWFNNIEFNNSAAELVSKLNKGDQIAFRGIVSCYIQQNSNNRTSKLVIRVDDSQDVEILEHKNSVPPELAPQPPEPYPFQIGQQTKTRKSIKPQEAAPIIPESFDLGSRMNF